MLIRVSLVYSPAARQVFECHLELEQGATVRQAVEASGVLRAFPSLDLSQGRRGGLGTQSIAQSGFA
jgi:putative ubiquitin-RnfH superfamily antitoxin RatB of RatAB toxin-antitoxin module